MKYIKSADETKKSQFVKKSLLDRKIINEFV